MSRWHTHWKTRDQALRYFRQEGFVTGIARCRGCGRYWTAVLHPESNRTILECPHCSAMNSDFEEEKPTA